MTPEEKKLLAEILGRMVEALYLNMGKEWAMGMYDLIDKLRVTNPNTTT